MPDFPMPSSAIKDHRRQRRHVDISKETIKVTLQAARSKGKSPRRQKRRREGDGEEENPYLRRGKIKEQSSRRRSKNLEIHIDPGGSDDDQQVEDNDRGRSRTRGRKHLILKSKTAEIHVHHHHHHDDDQSASSESASQEQSGPDDPTWSIKKESTSMRVRKSSDNGKSESNNKNSSPEGQKKSKDDSRSSAVVQHDSTEIRLSGKKNDAVGAVDGATAASMLKNEFAGDKGKETTKNIATEASSRSSPTANPFRRKPDALQQDLTVALRELAVTVTSHPQKRQKNRRTLMMLRSKFSRRMDAEDKAGQLRISRVLKIMASVVKCTKQFDNQQRVEACVKKFLAVDACDLRYEFNQRNHHECVQKVMGTGPRVSACQKRRRHAEFLLRRREDHQLAELREKASKCDSVECNERVEGKIDEEEQAVRQSRERRRNHWLKCDDNSVGQGSTKSKRKGSSNPPLLMPRWGIVAMVGGILLITVIAFFVGWIIYSRVQAKRMEGIAAHETYSY